MSTTADVWQAARLISAGPSRDPWALRPALCLLTLSLSLSLDFFPHILDGPRSEGSFLDPGSIHAGLTF